MELGYLNDEGDFKIEEKKSSKHAGGSYFSLTIYKDDKPSGKVHVYCDGGKLYSEVMYVNGEKDGVERRYRCTYPGNLFSYVTYKAGKRNGLARKYYTNGQVENEYTYNNDSIDGVQKVYYEDGKIEATIHFTDNKINGNMIYYFENGRIEETLYFKKDVLDDDAVLYWPNGRQKRRDTYENGKLKDGVCYDSNGTQITYLAALPFLPPDGEYPGVLQLAKFNGNMDAYIKANIRYPIAEKKQSINGTVYITFMIEPDGSVSNTKVLKVIPDGDKGFEDEAIRVVSSMPNWMPGQRFGLAIRVQYNLPIRFIY